MKPRNYKTCSEHPGVIIEVRPGYIEGKTNHLCPVGNHDAVPAIGESWPSEEDLPVDFKIKSIGGDE